MHLLADYFYVYVLILMYSKMMRSFITTPVYAV